jgi:hypothetical protein
MSKKKALIKSVSKKSQVEIEPQLKNKKILTFSC